MAFKDFLGAIIGMFAGKKKKEASVEDLSRHISSLRRKEEALQRENAALEAREKQLIAEAREATSQTTKAAIVGKIRADQSKRKDLAQRLEVLAQTINDYDTVHDRKKGNEFYKDLEMENMDVSRQKTLADRQKTAAIIETNAERRIEFKENLADADAIIDDAIKTGRSASDPELDAIWAEINAAPAAEPAAEKPASAMDDEILPAEKKPEDEKEK